MKRLARRLKALADGTRLRILGLLSVRPCCVCELAAILEVSQPTVTRHLQKLADAGFVRAERRGFFQIYSLHPEDEEAAAFLSLVLGRLSASPEMEDLRERLRRLEVGPPFLREAGCGCPEEVEHEGA
ncbi:ArsR/SmtB family transcription factor [Thermosulfurimonas marina]|uniref:ArsR/SmtB family transcription factor n=1 Tax=Thermosulfurimonas marina TaxID=2047767 RepID=UPI00144AEE80|nr:metalloregulator ArsR/SmtB family transcription factor [Thermosulfurimonas marina]